MAQIILDISANTHKNDLEYIKRMLFELKDIDSGKHEIIIKHQLFTKAGNNIPLDKNVFEKSYQYAENLGYKTTSSVFDIESLNFLLQYEIPFVKIANRRDLDWIGIQASEKKVPVYISYGSIEELRQRTFAMSNYNGCNINLYPKFDTCFTTKLLCVSKYPTTLVEYEKIFVNIKDYILKGYGISDHTTNWDLFKKYNPDILEVHYKLEDSEGLDAGPFSRTPEQLAEVL